MSDSKPKERVTARRYAANFQSELDSAALYRTLASAEKNPELAEVYRRLAAVEEAHAEFWKKNLLQGGFAVPGRRSNFRLKILAWMARRFGPGVVLPIINAIETSDSGQYDAQPEAVAGGLPAAERSHARILKAITTLPVGPVSGSTLAKLEGRHRGTSGNALRAAVLGANDGLVSNLSLVMGVTGAALDSQTILLTGLAGLIAGACSMAMGEWLSVNSARESYEQQVATEAAELEQFPEEEREELALIYQAKGVPAEQAKALAERLISDKSTALDTLVREELGIDPKDLGGSPWIAAATSFSLFTVGAIVPVIPFFFSGGSVAIRAAIALSGVALFVMGGTTALFTGRGFVFSGLRQLFFGAAAAAITYGMGGLAGMALSG